jgi:hypothetical protein
MNVRIIKARDVATVNKEVSFISRGAPEEPELLESSKGASGIPNLDEADAVLNSAMLPTPTSGLIRRPTVPRTGWPFPFNASMTNFVFRSSSNELTLICTPARRANSISDWDLQGLFRIIAHYNRPKFDEIS